MLNPTNPPTYEAGATFDTHGVYARFDFEPLPLGGDSWMNDNQWPIFSPLGGLLADALALMLAPLVAAAVGMLAFYYRGVEAGR